MAAQQDCLVVYDGRAEDFCAAATKTDRELEEEERIARVIEEAHRLHDQNAAAEEEEEMAEEEEEAWD